MIDSVVIIYIVATALLALLAIFLIFFVIIYKNKQKNNDLEKQVLKTAYEHEILNSGIAIQEQTLNYVSSEIHDNIGQVLSLTRMQLNNSNLSREEMTNEVDNLLGKAITDIRSLSHTLNTSKIKNTPITVSFLELLAHIKNTRKFKTEIIFDNYHPPVKESHLIIYRMLQEVVNNIIKHSKAEEIKAEIFTKNEITTIKIQDNGVGFNPTESKSGIGLSNLIERGKLANAKVLIDTEKGKGTTLIISF